MKDTEDRKVQRPDHKGLISVLRMDRKGRAKLVGGDYNSKGLE